jgi:hypothetical protein
MVATPPVTGRQGPMALSPAATAPCAPRGAFHVHNSNPADGEADFHRQLLAVQQDPQVRRVALRWVGAPDLAEDILQAAYCGLAAMKRGL